MRIKHLDIESESAENNDAKFYIIKNENTGRYVKLGMLETKYLLNTLGVNVNEVMGNNLDSSELNDDFKKQLYAKFEEWGFLDDKKKNPIKPWYSDLSHIKLFSFNTDKIISKIYPLYSKLYSKGGMLCFLSLVLTNIVLVALLLLNFSKNTSSNEYITIDFKLSDILFTLILMLLSIMAHELGHAVVCNKYGGKVKSMGLVLFYLLPCFYCDVTDIYSFKNKKQKMKVALAGIYSNLYMGVTFLLLGIILSFFNIILLPFFYFSITVILISFYNLFPFVKLDGYWFLSAWIEITNLMDKSIIIAYTSIFDRKNLYRIHLSNIKIISLSIYGVLVFLFKPTFWIYNIYIVSSYFNFDVKLKLIVLICGCILLFIDLCKSINKYYKVVKNDYDRMLKTI